jgi:hypothetical protein
MSTNIRPSLKRERRPCATPDCGRAPQRGRPYCWSCDPAVPEEQKRAARAARWRGRLVAPDFQTIGSRVRFREAVAEATMEGELLPPVAAIGLKAVDDAAGDLFRERTGLPAGAGGFVIERVVFSGRAMPLTALPAPPPSVTGGSQAADGAALVSARNEGDGHARILTPPEVPPQKPQTAVARQETVVVVERFSATAPAESADAG